ncbi:hypothetical protein GCM10011579_001010 [Streptomyces albiflavescens]|uniref:Peptidase M4 n=1 Tax=Streptomyces albiflavescens TaxID=1623582 RepID=A0A917XQV9_9ACTN|nr:hypothetical protein [Streptomyces albiflavescens]GGN48398.1 hypothetical protein GCM10011579_001010 [Streptomyces albiflavescens]
MIPRRVHVAAVAALALAGTVAIGGCGQNGSPSSGAAAIHTPAVSASPTAPGSSTPSTPGDTSTPAGPTSGWGPDVWSDNGGSNMMGGSSGSWGPGMMGNGMMGNWWLAGNGNRVQTLDQARQRATAFADRLSLRVGEIMQFSRNFYAELQTTDGHPATEVLVNPADGAVQIEYGPAMMWNTDYGMHYGSRSTARISAAQAQYIAQQWLHDHDSTLTAGDPESYPGYYTLHTMKSGKITGMLSVNSSTGQVWYHTWHGTYIATSQR